MFDSFGGISKSPTKGCEKCRTVTSTSFNSTEPLVTVVQCKDCQASIEDEVETITYTGTLSTLIDY